MAVILDCSRILAAVPPIWNVLKVNWVPGSPIDCAAIIPTASPICATLLLAKKDGVIQFSKNVQLEKVKGEDGTFSMISTNRIGEISLIDSNKRELNKWKVPYGSEVIVKDGVKVKSGDLLFAWDPYTDVILARHDGIVAYKDLIEGETYVKEAVEGGKKMGVVTESRNRNLSPYIEILDKKGSSSSKGSITSSPSFKSSRCKPWIVPQSSSLMVIS